MSAVNRAKRALFDACFQTGAACVVLCDGRRLEGAREILFRVDGGRFTLAAAGIAGTKWGLIPWAWVEEIRSEDSTIAAGFYPRETPEKVSKKLPPGWRVVEGGRAR